MSRSKECRKCGEPLVQDPDDRSWFICVECPCDPDDVIDEAEYTYGRVGEER